MTSEQFSIPDDIRDAALDVLRDVLAGKFTEGTPITFERIRLAREILGALLDQKGGA